MGSMTIFEVILEPGMLITNRLFRFISRFDSRNSMAYRKESETSTCPSPNPHNASSPALLYLKDWWIGAECLKSSHTIKQN